MNALVVDGDATARVMVRRILVRDFACDITEVDNGLDALDQLSEKQFGFMLLDPELPVIDGFRVLEAVRRTPEHQSLPVLIMTRQRDEAAVRKLAELGISDYLIKPLEATLTGARLSKLIGATGQANGGNGPANDHKRIPTLQPGASVMIVDGSSDFRQLFADALGEAATVTPVDSGVQALKRCKQVAPAAVFIGNELGVLHRDLLVSELRRIPAMFESLIIGIVEEDELETASQDTRWSSVVLRADTSQALSQKTSRFFDSQRPLDTVLRAHPS
ncbi:MAG: response regulator, partial [Vicinamibacterales bacterium]|nr:response regulator [Vicinamibacterales bacterium]